MILLTALFLLASYLLGAIPFGLILVRLRGGDDLRTVGSGNIGATNVARTAGTRLGAVTLLLDAAKGAVPVLAARFLFDQTELAAQFMPPAAGLAAFAGHIASPFLGFKGGKGVATALGVILASAPWVILPGLLVFLAVVRRWNFVSLGSMAAAASTPLSALLIGYPPLTALLALALALLIILRHRQNIQRLLQGTENPWRARNAS
jgi:glycerol-3-phosphate acyltransferase PlsY